MQPLTGLTVVSIEQAVAAPFATRQLADLGARVIKVERPGPGDFARDYDETVDGMSSHFVWLNRSKESVALDLKSEEGLAALRALVASADIFVQNLAPGAAQRLGLGAAELRAANPRLVHVSISGYGPGGPYTTKKAYDLLVQCEAGLVSITGTPETPVKVGISVADIAAGMYAYTGVLTALLRRGQTGEGATVDISMLEALGEWMGFPMYYAAYGGTDPARSGASHAAIAPYGPFPCVGDEQVFLGIQNEREWAKFCVDVLGEPALATDDRFVTNSLRVAHRDDLSAEIARAFAELTTDEVIERLETVGIANARLRDMRQFFDHEQLEARGRWREVASPVGTLRALAPPATLDGDEPVMNPVPAVGQHTDAVLAEFGLTPQETR
ncbi:CaiB/BaiF CoA transferase family protein [Knoellia sp. Soil729]|uniref:CaiB/BaiF CoA transferase family protein n=1 Tax=Knoellia sp. Soil729 TaxID=1736394 RepID=UPI0006F4E80F|nr:CaiB/BaiF CoA-transferase family protein [Knoellia sp. Soil729]KRE44142.1 carnitine dehydratase [Knoellia sp. Soil729]